MTTPDQFQPGQRIRVLDCPDHLGLIGEVLEAHHRQVRVAFPDGRRCWPRRVELVADDEMPKGVA